jgi:hypothetical protein
MEQVQGLVQQQIAQALQAQQVRASIAAPHPELAPLADVVMDLGATYGSRLPPHQQPRTPDEQAALGERFLMGILEKMGVQLPAQGSNGKDWAKAQTETGGMTALKGLSDSDIEKRASETAKAFFG